MMPDLLDIDIKNKINSSFKIENVIIPETKNIAVLRGNGLKKTTQQTQFYDSVLSSISEHEPIINKPSPNNIHTTMRCNTQNSLPCPLLVDTR